jgi:xylan 1,4-beta-xylosidase
MIHLEQKTEQKVVLPCLKCISIGRAYELLRDDIRVHLTKARKEIGFEYCRFHALFHDDMMLYM